MSGTRVAPRAGLTLDATHSNSCFLEASSYNHTELLLQAHSNWPQCARSSLSDCFSLRLAKQCIHISRAARRAWLHRRRRAVTWFGDDVCLTVTILRHQRPRRRYALYWVPFFFTDIVYISSCSIWVVTVKHNKLYAGGRHNMPPSPLLPLWAPKRLAPPSRPRLQTAT